MAKTKKKSAAKKKTVLAPTNNAAQRSDYEVLLNKPVVVTLSRSGEKIGVRELPLGEIDDIVKGILEMVERGLVSRADIDLANLDKLTADQIANILASAFGGCLSEFVALAATGTSITKERVKKELTLIDAVNLIKAFIYVNELPRVIEGFFEAVKTLAASRGAVSENS